MRGMRQRLLCNGRERKDGKETPATQTEPPMICRSLSLAAPPVWQCQALAMVARNQVNPRLAAAGVGAKSKLMLMLEA